MRLPLSMTLLLALVLGATHPAAAAEQPAPDNAPPARTILRVLTDSDYPPFNYLDEEGVLTGFNVDVARAVCQELVVSCDIRSAGWDSLLPALARGETDAVIASIAITPRTLAEADFTERYYSMPARFVSRKNAPKREVSPEGLESRRVGVVKGSAHEAYLAAFFPDTQITPFETEEAVREALQQAKIEALFGDAHSLMFWLSGTLSAGCCEFRGGAFNDERYFGDGIGIAVRKGDIQLKTEIDKALVKIRNAGRLEELYLRSFPMQVY